MIDAAFILQVKILFTVLGRRANHITSEFITSNGLKKATNIRRGEIPTQKVYAVGIPSEIYSSPSKNVRARGPIQEIMASPTPKSPVGTL